MFRGKKYKIEKKIQVIDKKRLKCFFYLNGEIITYRQFINFLKNKDEKFLKVFDLALAEGANRLGSAYFWECPPVSQETIDKEFEFALIKSESLDSITQDYHSFQKYFDKDKQATGFSSLSGDTLIVPAPLKDKNDQIISNYKNLKEFVKTAPLSQKIEFWKTIAEKLEENLAKNETSSKWLSTSGLGVSYLHVRIDSRPKYYSFNEYTQVNEIDKKSKRKIDNLIEEETINEPKFSNKKQKVLGIFCPIVVIASTVALFNKFFPR
ncbi:MAG: hypothetical protein GBAus27B_000311 [Mycoplasmataceae bacterium]|nr:MAG: hypothetical protein GBAus27B_000311 [Mycoplasmataceae bacterium]